MNLDNNEKEVFESSAFIVIKLITAIVKDRTEKYYS